MNETLYRGNTNNLVIAGIENQLDQTEKYCRTNNIPFVRIKEELKYEDLPNIIDEESHNVYLVHVNDLFGTGIARYQNKVQSLFEKYDSVHGKFWLGGESEGTFALLSIKEHGNYIGIFK